MAEDLTKEELIEIGSAISAAMGLNFQEGRLDDLRRGLNSAAPAFGFAGARSLAQWLKNTELTKKLVETLASHLTVGETYFFRDSDAFSALETEVLPALTRAREKTGKRLRVWSAGCATGEEAYSLAILISRVIPDYRSWNITVLATDINPLSLKRAEEGVYTEWSFRSAARWIKDAYFTPVTGGKYEVIERIKKMVTFGYVNLAEDAYPSLANNTNAMDVIFCRNVLMYFEPDMAKKAMEGLYRSMVEDGWLLVSPAEGPGLATGKFKPTRFGDCIFYRKEASKEGISAIGDLTVSPSGRPVFIPSAPEIKAPPTRPRPKAAVPTAKPVDAVVKAALPANIAYTAASALFEKGLYSECAKTLEAAALNGKPEARNAALLARAYANQGMLDAALKWSETAVATDKMNPHYHYLSAAILEEESRLDEAAKSLRRAIYFDHAFVVAHFFLGRLMQRQGDKAAAKKHFRNALDLLTACSPNEIVPQSEGMTAGRLAEIIGVETS